MGQALLLLIVAVIVVALGTVVARDPGQPQSGPSVTELARVAALERASSLNSSVQRLATTAAPETKRELQDTGATLRADIDALTIPEPAAPSATPSGGATPAGVSGAGADPSASQTPPPAGPATLTGLVDALTQSSTASLASAATADGAMARLLASVGTGQLLQARALAGAAGLPVPQLLVSDPAAAPAGASPTAAGTATAATATGTATAAPTAPPSCSAPQTPAPGLTADQALTAVVSAEQKAVYAYQVSATRLTDPASSQAVAVLSTHEERLAALRGMLRLQCLQLPKLEPGYALATAFTRQPATALAGLEDQLGLLYGDLIALSTGPVRGAAITALVQTAEHGLLWGPTGRALPGLDVAVPSDTPGAVPTGSSTGNG